MRDGVTAPIFGCPNERICAVIFGLGAVFLKFYAVTSVFSQVVAHYLSIRSVDFSETESDGMMSSQCERKRRKGNNSNVTNYVVPKKP